MFELSELNTEHFTYSFVNFVLICIYSFFLIADDLEVGFEKSLMRTETFLFIFFISVASIKLVFSFPFHLKKREMLQVVCISGYCSFRCVDTCNAGTVNQVNIFCFSLKWRV